MTSVNNRPPFFDGGNQKAGQAASKHDQSAPRANESPQSNKQQAHQGDIRDNHHHPNQNAIDNKSSDLKWCYYPVPGLHLGNDRNLMRPQLMQHPISPDQKNFKPHLQGDCSPPVSDPDPPVYSDPDPDPPVYGDPDPDPPVYGDPDPDPPAY